MTGFEKGVQKIYYSLQQQKMKSARITTITELVVVWSVCSTCMVVLVATVTHATLYALPQMLQGVVKLLQFHT